MLIRLGKLATAFSYPYVIVGVLFFCIGCQTLGSYTYTHGSKETYEQAYSVANNAYRMLGRKHQSDQHANQNVNSDSVPSNIIHTFDEDASQKHDNGPYRMLGWEPQPDQHGDQTNRQHQHQVSHHSQQEKGTGQEQEVETHTLRPETSVQKNKTNERTELTPEQKQQRNLEEFMSIATAPVDCDAVDRLYTQQKIEYENHQSVVGEKSRKFAVVTPAGDFSSVSQWLECGDRKFDLFIDYYGSNEATIQQLERIADPGKFRIGKGQKYTILVDWLREEPRLFDQYYAVGVFDDDGQKASTGKINALFEVMMDEKLTWLSPVWTGKGWNHINVPKEGSYLRYETWFDMGFIVWRKDNLVSYLQHHEDKVKGWHEDVWAWNFLGRNKLNECSQKHSAVVDAVVFHNSPTRADGVRETARSNDEQARMDSAKAVEKIARPLGFVEPNVDQRPHSVSKWYKDIPLEIKQELERCPAQESVSDAVALELTPEKKYHI